MDVSIIIVNYNTCRLTANCINSVFEKTTDISFELILIDNASRDGSKELFEKDSRIIYIYLPENIGFGRANNEGIKIAKGRNILFLNSDTLLINNAIKELSEYLDSHSSAGACGGNLFGKDMKPAHSYRMILPSIIWEFNSFLHGLPERLRWGKNVQFNTTTSPKEVGYICGADLMIPAHILLKVGMFSPVFFMYYEEVELIYRIRKAGLKIVSVPSAQIQHLEGGSFKYAKVSENKLRYIENSLQNYYLLCCRRDIVRRITLFIHLLSYVSDAFISLISFRSNKYKYLRKKIKFFTECSKCKQSKNGY